MIYGIVIIEIYSCNKELYTYKVAYLSLLYHLSMQRLENPKMSIYLQLALLYITLSFCLLEVHQHLVSQWPILPQDWHVESLTGQEALWGAWDFVQFLHAWWFWGFDVFCCCCWGWDWGHWLHLLTALTVLDLRPIALKLSAMAMWVLYVSSILAVVVLRSRVSNFLTSLQSVRAWTRWNWKFHSFHALWTWSNVSA